MPNPTPVAGSRRYQAVFANGTNHTCALAAGAPYCWGFNRYGQLGIGSQDELGVPTAADLRNVTGSRTFVKLVMGQIHTCGLTDAGAVYWWGAGGTALGGAPANDICYTTSLPASCALRPSRLMLPESMVDLSSGTWFTCALGISGRVWCWGSNPTGAVGASWGLGNGRAEDSPTPTQVAEAYRFASIVSGGNHTFGLQSDSRAFCWGNNFEGQLGESSGGFTLDPIPTVPTERFIWLWAGGRTTCGLARPTGTRSSRVLCWGARGYTSTTPGDGSVPKPLPPFSS